ncbi:hypothetical protein ACSL103130_12965 [Actinomyces slackii]|uniref:Uncharacterized protein n=2 Tax=Actinomyces slackii TaxID=52774 RepID=A0A3S4WHQ3_9ACTO|nr:hypothetical protein [Actinomyces slackii]VEG75194.1 Uncharacterised protein [Actinomyces slackii]
MSDGGGMHSLAVRFWRSRLYLFGGVVLLVWTVELAWRYRWAVAVAGVVAGAVAGARWCLRRW